MQFLRPCAPDRVECLVVSGGGMKGVASLGAVVALKKAGALKNLHTVVGTSAGALVAAALATGRASEALLKDLARGCRPAIDLRMLSYGLDSGRNLDVWIRKVLGKAYTFDEVMREHRTRLVVCATNVSLRRPEYFGPESSPDMDVALALRMSCAIPLYFSAVPHNDCLYADGAISDNFPLEWTVEHHGARTMGVCFAPRTAPINNLESYVGALIECSTRRHFPDHPRCRVLELDTGASSAFDFSMSPTAMRHLFRSGSRQARAWLKKHK